MDPRIQSRDVWEVGKSGALRCLVPTCRLQTLNKHLKTTASIQSANLSLEAKPEPHGSTAYQTVQTQASLCLIGTISTFYRQILRLLDSLSPETSAIELLRAAHPLDRLGRAGAQWTGRAGKP